MNFNIDKDRRRGIIGTIVFHLAVIIILFFVTMSPPDPPRPEIGMEVNLGYSDQGMGNVQPPKPVDRSTPKPVKAQPKKDNVVTQNTEESVKLDDSKTKVKEQPKEIVKEKEKEPEKEPEKVVNQDFVFKKKKKSTNGGNEGITGKPGDQGKPDGKPDATSYVGAGGNGNGISFSLSGRAAKNLAKPTNNSSEQGTVVIKIWVDRSGKVINARMQVSGTNTSSSNLQRLAIEAALKARFNTNPDATEVQTGTITYKFVL